MDKTYLLGFLLMSGPLDEQPFQGMQPRLAGIAASVAHAANRPLSVSLISQELAVYGH